MTELQELFDSEARKNQVYPLINRSDLFPGFMEFEKNLGLSPGGGAEKK